MRDLRVSFPKPCSEAWRDMTPAGRARICARCSKPVHDLSRYTLGEAEALLGGDEEVCVRARIAADGMVGLKPGRSRQTRRMVIAATATAALLAAGAPAAAKDKRPQGAIVGTLETFAFHTRISAAASGGQSFSAKAKSNGHFRIKHLPAGTYTLTFSPDCGDSWTVENVVVREGETIVPKVRDPNECIVVGLLEVETRRG